MWFGAGFGGSGDPSRFEASVDADGACLSPIHGSASERVLNASVRAGLKGISGNGKALCRKGGFSELPPDQREAP